jgi:anti-sigma-K factor RskA
MTCDELKALVMEYALGVLEPAQQAACDAHLAGAAHDGCLEALRAARAAVALIPHALPPEAPRPATWAAIEHAIDAPTPARRRRPWVAAAGWLVAAAAMVAVIALWRDRAQRVADAQVQQAAIAMLQRPDARLVTLTSPTGGDARATLIYRPDDPRVYLIGNGLRPPPGKRLQLWAVRGERQIPEGTLRADAAGAVGTGEIAAIRDGQAIDAFGVTVEPIGGGGDAHGPVMLYGKR